MYKLTPPDSHISFYGKAHVIEDEDTIKCQSYGSIVAEYDKESDTITIKGYFSVTTSRHIDSFCDLVGKLHASKQEKMDCVSY